MKKGGGETRIRKGDEHGEKEAQRDGKERDGKNIITCQYVYMSWAVNNQ